MKDKAPMVQQTSEIQRYPEDEINLHDILIVLRKKKKIIILVMIICTFLAVIYALLMTPIYQAKATFFPPSSKDVVTYNASALRAMPSDVSVFSEESKDKLFAIFRIKLTSSALKTQVFKQFELEKEASKNISEEEAIFRYFKSYTITEPVLGRKSKARLVAPYKLTLDGENPSQIATILNVMIKMANESATKEVRQEIKVAVNSKILALRDEIKVAKKESLSAVDDEITRLTEADNILKNTIKSEIKVLKENAKIERMDRIKQLEEAASIAHQVGLVEPFSSAQAEFRIEVIDKQSPVYFSKERPLDSEKERPRSSGKEKSLYSLGKKPLYYLGEEAIRAELKELKKRTLDDPFTLGLRDLEQELVLLDKNHKIEALINRKNNDAYVKNLRAKMLVLSGLLAIDLESINIKTVMMDQAAYAPTRKIKPKRSMIVAIGLLLGLMSGLFLAFFLEYLEKNPVIED